MAEFHLDALQFQSPGTVHADSPSHCHGSQGRLNWTEPSLMLFLTLVLFFWQSESAIKPSILDHGKFNKSG